MTKMNIGLALLSLVLFILLIASVAMTVGIFITASLKDDPQSYAIPSFIVRASGMNLNQEQQEKLEYCMASAKVLYMSEGIRKCLDRYDPKVLNIESD